MYLTVARQLCVMAIIAAIGFAFSKKNKFANVEQQFLSKILLFVINPCMIVSAFDVAYDGEKLKSLLFAIAVAFLFHIVMIFVATFFVRDNALTSSLARLGVVFSNSGFIGIPLIKGVFGNQGVFYLMGYIFVFNILQWTWGEYLMTKNFSLKKIVTNPNIIACAAGLILFCIPKEAPYVLIEPLRMIGNCNGAVSMVLLGLLFAHTEPLSQTEGGEKDFSVYKMHLARDVFFRLILCPLLLLAVTLLLVKNFSGVKDLSLIAMVLFIAASCPVGMTVSGYAVVFGKDTRYASLLVSVSSVLCIVTIPLLVRLLEAAI